ncbi:MAG: DEAD/DEAH box helicase, partial [Roseiflexaceae bacterium]
MKLEEIKPHLSVHGLVPNLTVTIINAEWYGTDTVSVTYQTPQGPDQQILDRSDEHRLSAATERPWSFTADGSLFRLVAEAYRIQLAHLFDPLLAVHTSLIDPLPHQISAVYDVMLNRQPLRFLLADDPGAGKTIMAGLLIKELLVRGDVKRCLIVAPGNLVEQWQDEMLSKFHLAFTLMTNENLVSAASGNWFLENNLMIARLDKLARNEDIQTKLLHTDGQFDLVIFDEAHKCAA